jgi:hypothetical protein
MLVDVPVPAFRIMKAARAVAAGGIWAMPSRMAPVGPTGLRYSMIGVALKFPPET